MSQKKISRHLVLDEPVKKSGSEKWTPLGVRQMAEDPTHPTALISGRLQRGRSYKFRTHRRAVFFYRSVGPTKSPPRRSSIGFSSFPRIPTATPRSQRSGDWWKSKRFASSSIPSLRNGYRVEGKIAMGGRDLMMTTDWTTTEVLKAVFPLLDGCDLASCMLVCHQWRDIARDDYFWKCLCAKKWPSVCKRQSAPTFSYQKLFLTFSKAHHYRSLPPPKLSFEDLEFYIDIWSEQRLIFSEAVCGSVLRSGIRSPPSGISDVMRAYLDGPDHKMLMPVEPRFTIPREQTVSVSILVGRRDNSKVACIVNRAGFGYVDWNAFRALAYEYLNFAPNHPFVSGIRAWVSLLFMARGSDEAADVFGMEIDFCDAASSENEVLWLLDMLDWKCHMDYQPM
ncbi:hypothetical protein Taro_017863 [Colocasia esculenta]|uniref:F-box domain-containing protein n=1 Tax=Colocasia esculenta TaxID=4460 RepID=A0A843V0P4_COLES|nr:hypothetical protein [Colocasia esculenta]